MQGKTTLNFSLLSSLNLNDQVSHRKKRTSKIVVLYILIFKFLDIKMEDKRFSPNYSKYSLTPICSYFPPNSDLLRATASSSRTARMAVFMMIVVLSGRQAECCSGSPRRYLYRELLGGSGELLCFLRNSSLL